MEKISVKLPEQQLAEVEALVERGEYAHRSEAVRAAIRELVADEPRPLPRQWAEPQQRRPDGGRQR